RPSNVRGRAPHLVSDNLLSLLVDMDDVSKGPADVNRDPFHQRLRILKLPYLAPPSPLASQWWHHRAFRIPVSPRSRCAAPLNNPHVSATMACRSANPGDS